MQKHKSGKNHVESFYVGKYTPRLQSCFICMAAGVTRLLMVYINQSVILKYMFT